jgi:hypothetical protein
MGLGVLGKLSHENIRVPLSSLANRLFSGVYYDRDRIGGIPRKEKFAISLKVKCPRYSTTHDSFLKKIQCPMDGYFAYAVSGLLADTSAEMREKFLSREFSQLL